MQLLLQPREQLDSCLLSVPLRMLNVTVVTAALPAPLANSVQCCRYPDALVMTAGG